MRFTERKLNACKQQLTGEASRYVSRCSGA